jgi:hypothetical protein
MRHLLLVIMGAAQPITTIGPLPNHCREPIKEDYATELLAAIDLVGGADTFPEIPVITASLGLSLNDPKFFRFEQTLTRIRKGLLIPEIVLQELITLANIGKQSTPLEFWGFVNTAHGLKRYRDMRCELHLWYSVVIQPRPGSSVRDGVGLRKVGDSKGVRGFYQPSVSDTVTILNSYRDRIVGQSGSVAEPEEDPIDMLFELFDTSDDPIPTIESTVLSSTPIEDPTSRCLTPWFTIHRDILVAEIEELERRILRGQPIEFVYSKHSHPHLSDRVRAMLRVRIRRLMAGIYLTKPALEFQVMMNSRYSGNSIPSKLFYHLMPQEIYKQESKTLINTPSRCQLHIWYWVVISTRHGVSLTDVGLHHIQWEKRIAYAPNLNDILTIIRLEKERVQMYSPAPPPVIWTLSVDQPNS